ncbi:PREDICTED: uncharacterized protein LOC109584721 [Amphimedon queenslandica]|uniref:Uncharacterized protein n=1 Tax=Amphimedon queenslandica TaxID=400682 RepID=A0A1X7U5F4_AMPQE|nr:PREDICTED: uncharacterized protein LOC109584721 [Amphimedon queenslandica]|eukprot:XP_019856104.1 PREDICTED: uncharacterized protein LOC109584721 [Amphimedon queenslandica]
MSFYYIKQKGQDTRIPLWSFNVVSEFSSTENSYRLLEPSQLVASQGQLFITNERDNKLVVVDEDTLEVKDVECIGGEKKMITGPHWMAVKSSISANESTCTVCVLPKRGFQDNCKLYSLKYERKGYLKISVSDLGYWSACSVCLGPNGNLLIGNSRYSCVYTYSNDSGFTQQIDVNCLPTCLAYDNERAQLHVCNSASNVIKVFSEDGSLLREYGQNVLILPQQIAIDGSGCSYIICCFNLRCFLSVFDSNGDHVYNVYGFEGPMGVAVSSKDDSVWISDTKKNCLVKLEGLCKLRPPFSLSLICQRTILLHMNELSKLSLFKNTGQEFSSWNQPVNVIIKGLSNPFSLPLLLKHGIKTDTIKWILCQRLNLSEKIKMSFKSTNGRHVTQLAHYMNALIVELPKTLSLGQ